MRYNVTQNEIEVVLAESTATRGELCDLDGVKMRRTYSWILAILLAGACLPLFAQPSPEDQDQPDAVSTGTASATNAELNDDSTPETSTEEKAAETNESMSPASVASDDTSTKPSGPPPSTGKTGFAAFQMIADRNIFNGNRSGQRLTPSRTTSTQRSVQVDAFSLVGTLMSSKGPVAFFDGTEPDFRDALKPGEQIAGFEVREVRYAGARLAQGTNIIDLAVGTGMRRENRGLWKPTTETPSFASTSSSRSSDRSNSSSGSSSRYSTRSSRNGARSNGGNSYSSSSSSGGAPAAEVNDILKRLMEQREKE